MFVVAVVVFVVVVGSFYGVDICTVFTCVLLTAEGCQIPISHAPCPPHFTLSRFANIARLFLFEVEMGEVTVCVCVRVSGFTYVHSLPTKWNLLHHIKSNRFDLNRIWRINDTF